MPSVSMFYGITIYMFNNGREHLPPHFHAEYGEYEASFDLDGNLIKGDFDPKKSKLVTAWAILHKDELEANWKLCEKKEEIYKIEPLK